MQDAFKPITQMSIKLIISTCMLIGSQAFAASTLQFSNPFAGFIASNFADASGAVKNGMQWGIVVDTSGNGFSGLGAAYDSMTGGTTSNGFMSFSGLTTDDYFVSSGAITADSSAALEADFTTTGASGSIGNISVTFSNGISQSDAFGIIWFDTNSASTGDRYGFLNLGQVMPADNLPAIDMSAPFAGTDPIRAASFTFGGAAVVPEPSRLMLLGLGFFGLFFRRRR